MIKRLFWLIIGVVIGVMIVTKAQAYIRARMPKNAGRFLLGEDTPELGSQTLQTLWEEFNAYRQQREEELQAEYSHRRNR